MSVMIISDATINRLASFAVYHALAGGRSAPMFASYLKRQNVAAYEKRYGDGHPTAEGEVAFDWTPMVDPVQIVADAESFIYNVEPVGELENTIHSIHQFASKMIA